jgi:hypothetical protein
MTVHLLKHSDSVLTYCGLPVIDNDISFVTIAHALDSAFDVPFDCVDCHKKLTVGQKHSRPEEE